MVAAQSPAPDKAFVQFIQSAYPDLAKLYQHLHEHPELSFQEKNTSARMAAELKSLGYAVTQNIGGYGIVGVLKNGSGPTVLIRTDLDALPILEETGLPYASKALGKSDDGKDVPVMQACGHDVHMTVFTGVAKTLAQFKNNWKGTLVLIGQPAEERSGGAKAMLQEGLFTKFPKPDYVVALHTNASIPAGQVGYTEGNIMANVDAVDITVRGIGGHGAVPDKAKDPVVLASQLVMALQTIVSRETSPFQPAVVTVGSIHGGTSFNVIPDEVKLQLTLRSYSDEVRNNTIASIKRMCDGLGREAGLPENRLPLVTVRDQFTPFTYNDIPLTRRLTASFKRVLGPDKVVETPPSMVGEDFSFYGRTEAKIPVCMFWLGTVDPKKIAESKAKGAELPGLHSSKFAPLPEPTIKTGVLAMSTAVLDLFNRK
ncbi:putative amidohydrolase [Adhaeribacter aerolatus]|uniref:Putative amidohydrolase n=2 Tax=Adhaeribacter aerolatus TaxID=670289 RepID=A0A512B2K9_9BACT|nr:putative amidohydrolase [Adhaeribacter aerolatus]